jgi:hypothetical protein
MKKLLALFALVTCLVLRAQDNEINWLGSYDDAIQQAKKTQKPILVEFRCEA